MTEGLDYTCRFVCSFENHAGNSLSSFYPTFVGEPPEDSHFSYHQPVEKTFGTSDISRSSCRTGTIHLQEL
ncbi:hypothetical protein TNCV_4338981 [Trichonephila clavipes]|nr:hypothetical protein TNCV_4338981 [Trichonephila clavipes]